jgi:hypothetical protein
MLVFGFSYKREKRGVKRAEGVDDGYVMPAPIDVHAALADYKYSQKCGITFVRVLLMSSASYTMRECVEPLEIRVDATATVARQREPCATSRRCENFTRCAFSRFRDELARVPP